MDTDEHQTLKFSHHARVRQQQRDITDNDVNHAMQSGEKVDGKDSQIFIDQNVKIVFSTDNRTVITVNKNRRNTDYLLSEKTQVKKEYLTYEANVKNNNSAMCELAELYLTDELGEKDVKKAYDLFERAANMGNSHAMSRISVMYETGCLGENKEELADRWLKRAADRSNGWANAYLGQKLLAKYLKNYPLNSSKFRPSAPKKEILHYLSKAAHKSHTRGTWALANIYENGLLGEKDISKAIELYVEAAKIGSPSSLDSLYQLSLDCNFSSREIEEILDYVSSYLPKTSLGNAFNIGLKQILGDLGYNPVRGLNMIEQVALKQYDQAILQLATCYLHGIRCKENLNLAQYWFLKLHNLYDASAKVKNIISLQKLGFLYLNGQVGDIDLDKAESCLKEFTNKSSDPINIYDLAKLYIKGKLGDKPFDFGIKLIAQVIKKWQLQAESGDQDAYYYLGAAYTFIKDEKKAVHWLSKASSTDVSAKILLTEIYLDELSHEKNIPRGLQILESIILEHNISPASAFENVNFTVNPQTIIWLQDIVHDTKATSGESCNKKDFQKFVLTTLAHAYESGKLDDKNYILTSKYYHQLFVDFNSLKAKKRLVHLYNNEKLPSEYYDSVKDWVLKIPSLLEDEEIKGPDFQNHVLLLGELYKNGSILPYNIYESSKWLYLASYFWSDDNDELKRIIKDIESIPPIEYNIKVQIVAELSEMTNKFKTTSLPLYKKMTRILGDIFYDKKIVDQNIDESINWYTESSSMNNSLASLKLGKIYQYDKKDFSTSVKWYVLSAQQGNQNALKMLSKISHEKEYVYLLDFLNKYHHRSTVQESELINIKPYKNLETYPKTAKKMYDLGMSHLNLRDPQNILNAAYWFREAHNKGNIDAALELYFMYKSGKLGLNLIPSSENLYLNILGMCYSQLTECYAIKIQNIPTIVSLLKSMLTVVKISNLDTATSLKQEICKLVDESQQISPENLKDVISGFKKIILQLKSESSLPQAVEIRLLSENIADSLVV